MVNGILRSIERFYLRHPELCWKGKVQHLGCERGLCLLHQGVHRIWSSALYNFLHVAELLLDALEPLFPRLLPHSLLMRSWLIASNVSLGYCFAALLFGGKCGSCPLARLDFASISASRGGPRCGCSSKGVVLRPS